jgi:hypothetical protein
MAAPGTKRKRPTRLRVKDDQALAALLQFGIYHRAAIADHLLKRFKDAKQLGDRLSIGAEAFFCMIAAVEDLEMLYFAMREKVANQKHSFLALYAGIFIKEPAEKKKQKPTDKSARNMRRQLRTMSLGAFQRELGLPRFEEWLALDRAPAGSTRQKQRSHYFRELLAIKTQLWQAVRNRALSRIMSAYNKVKHGFVVLPDGTETILLVEKAESVGKRTSSVQVMPFKITETSVQTLVDNTKQLALTVRQLLLLYTRTEMIPPTSQTPT